MVEFLTLFAILTIERCYISELDESDPGLSLFYQLNDV